jgi:hypothetical protein
MINETDHSYPTVLRSACNKARIIRYKYDLQFSVLGQQGGRWRNLTYHFGRCALG